MSFVEEIDETDMQKKYKSHYKNYKSGIVGMKRGSRKCTNICSIMVFLSTISGMFYLTKYGYEHGNVYKFI